MWLCPLVDTPARKPVFANGQPLAFKTCEARINSLKDIREQQIADGAIQAEHASRSATFMQSRLRLSGVTFSLCGNVL